jgi:hypothetical protein
VFISMYAAHQVGDHWLQRSAEALGKGARSWRGRLLCASHVGVLTVTKLAALSVTAAVVELHLSALAVALGLAVDAFSHYVADRRRPLGFLARLLGKGEFWRLGDGGAAPAGTGAYAMDQSWHVAWLFVAALIACLGVA